MKIAIMVLALCLSGCITDDAETGRQHRHDRQLIERLGTRPEFEDLLQTKFTPLFRREAVSLVREYWMYVLGVLAAIERAHKEWKQRKVKS